MATAKKKTEEIVEIKPIKLERVKLRVVGETPLIVHAWSEKAKRQMTRAIVSTGNRMYQPITTVLSDADLRSRLLDAAKREMLTFKMKYRHLHELAAVFEAMDTVQ